jgi:hypothetical protein
MKILVDGKEVEGNLVTVVYNSDECSVGENEEIQISLSTGVQVSAYANGNRVDTNALTVDEAVELSDVVTETEFAQRNT